MSGVMTEERDKINELLEKYFNNLIKTEEETNLKEYLSKIRDYMIPKGSFGGPAKRIRPQVLIHTFFGIAGDSAVDQYLDEIRKLSLSVELLHTSQIIHEDVIDQDDYRRGLPAFHKTLAQHFMEKNQNVYGDPKRWGNGITLHGGNLCYVLGAQIIINSKFDDKMKYLSLKQYLDGYSEMIRGEIIDHYLMTNNLENSSMEDYIIMAESKTSQLFLVAASIGAILADGRASQIIPLQKAIIQLGVAYHIKNDIVDTIKEKKKDIALRKRNILLITAYKNSTDSDKKIINDILNKKADIEEAQAEQIREIIKTSGALEFAKIYAQNCINTAKTDFDKIYPGLREDSSEFFNTLCKFTLDNI
jgi:geranylgeranyl diphosphate synthase type I